MSDETHDESTETEETQETGEGQAQPQTQENQGTQGQPTVAEDGVEHNQHIESPEETAEREADEGKPDSDADDE